MADSSEPEFQARSDWHYCRPWFAIFYALRSATSFRALALAALGLIGTVAGWRMFWNLLMGPSEVADKNFALPEWPWQTGYQDFGSEGIHHIWQGSWSEPYVEPVLDRVAYLTVPFQYLFDRNLTYVELAYVILCGIWALAVWSFFGGAITRLAALRLTRDELPSTNRLKEFALSRWKSYFRAPLFPLLGIAFIAFGVAILGLFAHSDTTAIVTAIFWPFALLAGLLMTILLIGLAFGWPLMWATVSTEGKDAFDALSRSYAYVFQRPLLYIVYAVMASIVGIIGYFLVRMFATLVVYMTLWAASWGAGTARMDKVAVTGLDDPIGSFASVLIIFCNGAVMTLAAAFAISYLWCSAVAIYLLLRRHVDAAELDQVNLDPQEENFALPSLEADANESPAASQGDGPSEQSPEGDS